jgi:hypothetical protein
MALSFRHPNIVGDHVPRYTNTSVSSQSPVLIIDGQGRLAFRVSLGNITTSTLQDALPAGD